MVIAPGFAVVDTAASQCLIGTRRFKELSEELRKNGYEEKY